MNTTNSFSDSSIAPTQGTSFSSPYLLRTAAGIRAILGQEVSLLAIKAMLVHTADTNGHEKTDVGWGRPPSDVYEIIESKEGEAKILYQGELHPGKYMRAPVPVPKSGINGRINIKATCCILSPVDSADSSMYSRAGVEISWFPKKGKKSKSFFKQQTFSTEAQLRSDAGKWESVLSNSLTALGSALDKPEFEIHYISRAGGASTTKADTIKYAFLITISAPKHKSIFNDIIDNYQDILSEIKPRVTVPVEVST